MPLLLPAAVALCAALVLVLARHLLARHLLARPPSPRPEHPKQPVHGQTAPPTPAPADVEKGESPPPTPLSCVSDINLQADLVDEVWPPVGRDTHEVTPTLRSALPDVPLVWGMDYSFDARPPMAAIDRRPLMAYSHLASALGVDEPDPLVRSRSRAATDATLTLSPSSATDTRPTRSRSLISGIVSDWNSLTQTEQQAWATLSEARAARSRGTNSRTRACDS